jgi:hypothetical protein
VEDINEKGERVGEEKRREFCPFFCEETDDNSIFPPSVFKSE